MTNPHATGGSQSKCEPPATPIPPQEDPMPNTPDPQAARYRQRPNEAEAIQWTGDNAEALRAFAGPHFDTIDPEDRIDDPDQDAQLLVEASHWVGIKPTDWVLKFDGYFVAKSDVPFRAVWEPATPPSAAETTNPAALYREAADIAESLRQFEPTYSVARSAAQVSENVGILRVADELRRLANEAEFAATPCSPVVPCEDGGEPCDVHERMLGHYDDSHELCPPNCQTADGPSRVVAEEQPAETSEPVKPTSRTWTFEVCYEGDKWHGCGGTYDDSVFDNAHKTAQEDFQHRVEKDKQRRRFRMIRATTTYIVETEHTPPAVGEQPDTQTREAVCFCGHGSAYHDAKYGGPRCRLCPDHGDGAWAHAFAPDAAP